MSAHVQTQTMWLRLRDPTLHAAGIGHHTTSLSLPPLPFHLSPSRCRLGAQPPGGLLHYLSGIIASCANALAVARVAASVLRLRATSSRTR